MALTDAQIDQLVAQGMLSPTLAGAMKARNATTTNLAPAMNAAIAQGTIAANATNNTRPMAPQAAPIAARIAPAGMGSGSPYDSRTAGPSTGSPAGTYLAPSAVYGMMQDAKANGGIVPPKPEYAIKSFGPNGIAPGGPTTIDQQLAKVPANKPASETVADDSGKTINPSLVNGLKSVGAISPETADKLHALNDDEKKKKEKG